MPRVLLADDDAAFRAQLEATAELPPPDVPVVSQGTRMEDDLLAVLAGGS